MPTACLCIYDRTTGLLNVQDQNKNSYPAHVNAMPVQLRAFNVPGQTGRMKITFSVPPGSCGRICLQQLGWGGGCVPDVIYRVGHPGLPQVEQFNLYQPNAPQQATPCRELTVCYSADGTMQVSHPLGLNARCDMNVLGADRMIALFLLDDPAPGAAANKGLVVFDGDNTLRPSAVPTPVWIQTPAGVAVPTAV